MDEIHPVLLKALDVVSTGLADHSGGSPLKKRDSGGCVTIIGE